MGGGGWGGEGVAKTNDKTANKHHTFHHLMSKTSLTAQLLGGECPFQIIDVRCGESHRANERRRQSVTSVTSSTSLKKPTNNQKCRLTWFILSKVNVQNNKKHVSGRDIVQRESTDSEEHWAPVSSPSING